MKTQVKNALRHIATPFANVLTYLLVYAVTKLAYTLLSFLNKYIPYDYHIEPDSVIMQTFYPLLAMYIMSLVTKNIAPSRHYIHFFTCTAFLLFCDIYSLAFHGSQLKIWCEIIGIIIGSIIGYFILRDKDI